MSDGPSAGGRWDDEDERALQKPRNKMSTRPAINTHVRLFDLVRYARAELHEDGLITDEEYGWLCTGPMAMSPKGGSPSRQRLEDYDELRANLIKLERVAKRLADALAKWQHVWKETECEQDDCANASERADAALRDFEELKK